ncbi:MAG: hypothetical protein GF329_08150 [Candidatus Lokiarchaeota archaeon]|nr:hypothetical protein [Candidatus Lokiarchaeota archaeon]
MSESDDEGSSVLKDIEKGYRFRWYFQVLLVGIIMGVLIVALLEVQRLGLLQIIIGGVNIGFITSTLICVWVLAFIWPVIIKVRNRLYKSVSMGLFFAAISIFITFLLFVYQIEGAYLPSTPLLLLAFGVGIGAQLCEHLNPRLIKTDLPGYLTIGIVSLIFAVCTFIFLYAIMGIVGIYVSVFISALFVWSLIPEEPF